MPLVLDIETVPLAASMEAAYPEFDRTPPANYKSDEAIAKWRTADRAKWEAERAKECSLNPRLGRIVCIGTSTGTLVAPLESNEADILRAFWDEVLRHDGRVVTWNGSWDLRFIVLRSLFHGVEPTVSAETLQKWFKKYTTEVHFDCKAVLLNWDVRVSGEGLDEWAEFFGVEGKLDGINGADVYPLYLADQLEEIAQYCAADVAATQAIYERIAPVYGGSLASL